MADYVDVAERIGEFRAKHPEGSLQSRVLRWPEEGFPFIVVEARAYRSPDDTRPGVGLAQENFPGRTPYTHDSELQNAETSAWGRAIVAALAADTRKGIASRQEVARTRSGGAGDQGGTAVGRQPTRQPAPSGSSGGSGQQAYGEGVSGPGPRHKPGCDQPGMTDLKPDGSPMPRGKLICTGCGVVAHEAEVS